MQTKYMKNKPKSNWEKKIIKLYEKVFNAEVEVILEKPNDKKLSGETMEIDKVNKDGTIYRRYRICLENKKDFYTLLHETVHLVEKIFSDRGIPFTSENSEIIAYYQTYWFKQIWRKINEKLQNTN